MYVEKRKNYPRIKEWREKNREKLREQARRAQERKRAIMREAKDRPCVDCGVQYHYSVMQFDHVRGVKKLQLCSMHVGSWGPQTIRDEIAKCEVVCANCHAYRTWKRFHEPKIGIPFGKNAVAEVPSAGSTGQT